MCFNKITE